MEGLSGVQSESFTVVSISSQEQLTSFSFREARGNDERKQKAEARSDSIIRVARCLCRCLSSTSYFTELLPRCETFAFCTEISHQSSDRQSDLSHTVELGLKRLPSTSTQLGQCGSISDSSMSRTDCSGYISILRRSEASNRNLTRTFCGCSAVSSLREYIVSHTIAPGL